MATGKEVLIVMIKVADISLNNQPKYIPDSKMHDWLEKTPVKDWPPIMLRGKRLIDGLHRVMFAIEYNIPEIPGIIT